MARPPNAPDLAFSQRLWLALATAGGLGHAPVAPGTWGAAGGVALYLVVVGFGSFAVLLTLVALLALGIPAAHVAERHYGQRDDGRIVVDEVAGQLVALLPLLLTCEPRSPLLVLAGFLLFRLFDIWKPGPVRWVERRLHGGLGVVCDDLVAGLLAAAAVSPLAWVYV